MQTPLPIANKIKWNFAKTLDMIIIYIDCKSRHYEGNASFAFGN